MTTVEADTKGIGYKEYRKKIDNLLAEGKVTGEKQSEILLEFTKLNIQRMNRIDKTTVLSENLMDKIHHTSRKMRWLILSQGWCGDCAQLVPVFGKIADASQGKIELNIVNPDERNDLMERFSTNGSRSVPKVAVLDADSGEVIGVWGPRPKPAQDIMLKWKATNGAMSKDDFEKELHTWYAKDKTLTAQSELAEMPIW
jgi:thioredoxin-like negative regulator of GroEL